jgi:hypothetical protein
VLVVGRLNTPIVALLYLLPVGLATSLGGLSLGILASLLAFLAFNYFFIPPYYTLAVHQTEDLIVLGVFLGVAVVVSQLLGRARASVAAAEARERETTALYELSTALTGLRSEAAIAQAERLREISGQLVELTFRAPRRPRRRAVPVAPPADASAPAALLLVTLLLATARGRSAKFGCGAPPPPGRSPRRRGRSARAEPAEARLLATFAGQARWPGTLSCRRPTQAKFSRRPLKSALLSSVAQGAPLASMKAPSPACTAARSTGRSPALTCWPWLKSSTTSTARRQPARHVAHRGRGAQAQPAMAQPGRGGRPHPPAPAAGHCPAHPGRRGL